MLVAVIILLILIVIAITLFIVLKARKNKYCDFIVAYSVTLDNLIRINEKYHFYPYKNFDEAHTYDNENFYTNISCEDYLIYQLQFKKDSVKQEIKNMEENKKNYEKYVAEIESNACFGTFTKSTDKMNLKYLKKLELKIVNMNVLAPYTKLRILIRLYLSNINGRVYKEKSEYFESNEILSLIKRLEDKSGAYYRDREIWDAICRVERGRVSNKMRFSIYQRDGYRCCNCGRSGRFYDLEIDHIKPIAKGGKSTYDNLQTLCRRCNKEKGDKY